MEKRIAIASVLAGITFALGLTNTVANTQLLVAGGMIFAVTSVIATDYFANMTVPGPILGVVFGLAIFGMGAAKGVGTARAPVMAAR